jgi:hypothetical protein
MESSFSVEIALTGETVDALQEFGFRLYAFRVVGGAVNAKPIIWFQTTTFELSTTISWTEDYQAYTSRSDIIPRGHIDASASYPLNIGEVLEVTNPMGIGEVRAEGGTEGAICVVNLTSTRLTCGISQTQPDGSQGPICAFKLLGNNMDEMIPIPKIYLMFSSIPLDTGAVVEQAYGPGILIDLEGVNTRCVRYDADASWSWDENEGWATSYPPNQKLVPLLIQPRQS